MRFVQVRALPTVLIGRATGNFTRRVCWPCIQSNCIFPTDDNQGAIKSTTWHVSLYADVCGKCLDGGVLSNLARSGGGRLRGDYTSSYTPVLGHTFRAFCPQQRILLEHVFRVAGIWILSRKTFDGCAWGRSGKNCDFRRGKSSLVRSMWKESEWHIENVSALRAHFSSKTIAEFRFANRRMNRGDQKKAIFKLGKLYYRKYSLLWSVW